MRTFRCHCGQALTAVASGIPGTPFYVSDEAAAKLVADALKRHLPRCPEHAKMPVISPASAAAAGAAIARAS
jgi:hypothetical protein